MPPTPPTTSEGGNEQLIGKAIEAGIGLIGSIFSGATGGQRPGGNAPTIVRQEKDTNIGLIIFVLIFAVMGIILIFKK